MGYDLRAVTVSYTVPDTDKMRRHFPELAEEGQDAVGDRFAERVREAAADIANEPGFYGAVEVV